MKKFSRSTIKKYKNILLLMGIILFFSFIAGYLEYNGFEVFLNIKKLIQKPEDSILLALFFVVTILLSFYIKTIILSLENLLTNYPILVGILVSGTIFILGLGNLNINELFLLNLTILLTFTILFVLNFLIFKLIPKEENLSVEKDFVPERTSKATQKIYTYLSKESVQTIQINGDWGSGKTHILKSLYNEINSDRKSKYIPIYIPLDQINSTSTFISRFEKSLNKRIFSICGYKSAIELSQVISEFYQKEDSLLSKLINLLLVNQPSTFKDFDKIKLLQGKQVVAIIDDCDRILSIEELKFILEFILHLKNYSKSFKIIFSANRKQVSPFIGYNLIKSYGEIDADFLDSLAEIASNTESDSSSIHRMFSSSVDNNTIIALGDLYLDKFRDIQILIDPLPDKSITEIFLKQLEPFTNSERIDLSTIQEVLAEKPLTFNGDFRLMKRLLTLLTNTDLSKVKDENLDFYEIVLLGLYYVSFKRRVTSEDIRYLETAEHQPYFKIEGRSADPINSLINDRSYREESIRNKEKLSSYLETIFI